MRRRILINAILISGVVFGCALWVSLTVDTRLKAWQPYQWLTWPLALLVTGVGIWLSLPRPKREIDRDSEVDWRMDSNYVVSNLPERGKNHTVNQTNQPTFSVGKMIRAFMNHLRPAASGSPHPLSARRSLLDNVAQFWVQGVLKGSLHNGLLLTLGMEERPSDVGHPWTMVRQTPAYFDHLLPAGTTILEVFQRQKQSLLILSAPGGGKTTMLLELARELLVRAQQDDTQPIPVVLNLSAWAVQQPTLEEWLVTELNHKYYVDPQIARTWVEGDALLLLLDGLDEVPPMLRDACVHAINTFRNAHPVACAVASRLTAYETLQQPLQLQSAVLLQPLTPDQIDKYFARLGAGYSIIRIMLQKDPVLQELAQSPLMLSMMTVAYWGTGPATLDLQSSLPFHRQHLFDTYIKRMFQQCTASNQPYTAQQTLRWLTELAQSMDQHQQTVFLTERLNARWFQLRTHIGLHQLIAVLILGLAAGLTAGLSVGVGKAIIIGLSGMLMGVLIFGLYQREERTQSMPSDQSRWQAVRNIWGGGLLIGLLTGLIFGLRGGLSNMLIVGLILGLIGMLVGWLVSYNGDPDAKPLAIRNLSMLYNRLPLNYVRFLDYCADHLFLRKVGGGYIFIHRLLLEHFADMEEEDIGRLARLDRTV